MTNAANETYTMKSGFVSVDTEETEFSNAARRADAWASYSQEALELYLNGVLVAWRPWYGCVEGVEHCEDPLQFGDFGYYSDWEYKD